MIRRPPTSTLFPHTTLSRSLPSLRPGRERRDPPPGRRAPTRTTSREASSSTRAGRVRRRVTGTDRKSTRLNSSHANISYALFCLKKKQLHHLRPLTSLVAHL